MAVRLPGSSPAETYLDVEAVLEAARRTGADAIHPGYGFLSENAGFARAVEESGRTWVGPSPESIEAMGSKIGAKDLMRRAGVPVLEAPDEPTDADLPLLVKASAGGGGRGMRVVRALSDLDTEVAAAREEAHVRLRRRHRLRRAVRRARPPRRGAGRRRPARRRPRARRARLLDPAPPPEGRGGVPGPRPGRRGAGRAARGSAPRRGVDRVRRCRHRGVPLRPGVGAVLVPRDEHAAPGRAPGDRGGLRGRPGRAPADGRRGRPGRARGDDPERPRDRGPALRRGPRRRLAAAERHADPLRDPHGRRGPGRCRVRVRQRGVDALRRDAGQGDRARPDPAGSRARPRRRAVPGEDPRDHHQPGPAGADPAQPRVPRRPGGDRLLRPHLGRGLVGRHPSAPPPAGRRRPRARRARPRRTPGAAGDPGRLAQRHVPAADHRLRRRPGRRVARVPRRVRRRRARGAGGRSDVGHPARGWCDRDVRRDRGRRGRRGGRPAGARPAGPAAPVHRPGGRGGQWQPAGADARDGRAGRGRGR